VCERDRASVCVKDKEQVCERERERAQATAVSERYVKRKRQGESVCRVWAERGERGRVCVCG